MLIEARQFVLDHLEKNSSELLEEQWEQMIRGTHGTPITFLLATGTARKYQLHDLNVERGWDGGAQQR